MLPAADRAVGLQLDHDLESPVEHRLLGPAPESVAHRERDGTQDFFFHAYPVPR